MIPATEPPPTDGPTPVGLVPDDPTSVPGWVEWFLGVPLKVIITVVAGAVVLLLLRRFIRTVTEHLAQGTPQSGPLGRTGVGSTLLTASPLATARRAQRARTLGSVLRSTAGIVVGGITFVLVLATLGVNVVPLVASAGVVGVALGFGAQSLVKDFLSGTFMLLEDQYGVGDVVDVGPAAGTVEAVALRVTKIRDGDGTLWYVPNGSMTRVGNKTQGWAKATVEIKVDYFVDLDEVRRLLTEAAAGVRADPKTGSYILGEPDVTGIEDLTSEAVTLRLSVRTQPAMQWAVARDLREAVRAALDEAGIPLAGQVDAMAARRAAREGGQPGGVETSPGGAG
jgi:small-conductance mechanosensitive channel